MENSRSSDTARSRIIAVAFAVAAIVFLALSPTLGGYFLSDDFAYVYNIAEQHNQQGFLDKIVAQFTRGLNSGGDHYYRPLTYASLALDYVINGVNPFGYRLTNLLLHAANAAMVAALYLSITRQAGMPVYLPAAALAGLLFGIAPSSMEVASWVSGRFDALATFLLLLTLVCFVRSDRWRHLAPVFLTLAFMAKESAVLTVLFAGLIALLIQRDGTGFHHGGARFVGAAWRLVPLLVITALYFLWRWHIFGTPFKVYATSNSLPSLLTFAWLRPLWSFPEWFRALTDASFAGAPLLAGTLAATTLVFIAAWQDRRVRCLALMCAISLVVAYALVFSNNPGFASDGRHGRLFYQMLIPAVWLLALPLSFMASSQHSGESTRNHRLHGAPIVSSVAILLSAAWLTFPAMAAWRDAGEQSRAMRDQLRAAAEKLSAGEYGIAFAPEWHARVPFALNAQGSFVMPPFQPIPLSGKLILQTDLEFASFTKLAEAGLVNRLKRESLASILHNTQPAQPITSVEWPERYWCWHSASRTLKPMSAATASASKTHVAHLQSAWTACRDLP